MFVRKEDPLRMEDEELGARLFNRGAGPDGLTGFRLEIPEGVISFIGLMKTGKNAAEVGGDQDPARAIWEVTITGEAGLPVSLARARDLISRALADHKAFNGRPEGATLIAKFRSKG